MNRAIAMALAEANVPREKIDYVNVHGTGTRANDAAEQWASSDTLAMETMRLACHLLVQPNRLQVTCWVHPAS